MDVGPKLKRNANLAVRLFQILTNRLQEYLGRFLVAVQLAEEDDLGVEGVDTGYVDGPCRAVANVYLRGRSVSREEQDETWDLLRYSFRHCVGSANGSGSVCPLDNFATNVAIVLRNDGKRAISQLEDKKLNWRAMGAFGHHHPMRYSQGLEFWW